MSKPFKMKYTHGKKSDSSVFPFKSAPTKFLGKLFGGGGGDDSGLSLRNILMPHTTLTDKSKSQASSGGGPGSKHNVNLKITVNGKDISGGVATAADTTSELNTEEEIK